MTLVAMEPPASLSAEDVRDEKVKVLKSMSPLSLDRLVIGQFGPCTLFHIGIILIRFLLIVFLSCGRLTWRLS